jgi:hypothetical protein
MKKFGILMYGIISELYTKMIVECLGFSGGYPSRNNSGDEHHSYEVESEEVWRPN